MTDPNPVDEMEDEAGIARRGVCAAKRTIIQKRPVIGMSRILQFGCAR